jgi:hypothetical protein
MPLDNPEYGNAPLIISRSATNQVTNRARLRDCIPFYTNLRQAIVRGSTKGMAPLDAARALCQAVVPADEASGVRKAKKSQASNAVPGPSKPAQAMATALKNSAATPLNSIERLDNAIALLRQSDLTPSSPPARSAASLAPAVAPLRHAAASGPTLSSILPRRTMGDWAKADTGRRDGGARKASAPAAPALFVPAPVAPAPVVPAAPLASRNFLELPVPPVASSSSQVAPSTAVAATIPSAIPSELAAIFNNPTTMAAFALFLSNQAPPQV